MAKVEAVMINIKSGDELKTYTVLNKEVSESDSSIFTHEGKNYVKVKLSNGTYKYVLPDEGKEAVIETKPEKEEEPTSTFFSFNNSKYDRAVDGIFNAADNLIGIDNSKLTTDGENDGKIGFWEGAKRFLKGAVLNPIKSMVKHPLITIGAIAVAGLAIAAAPIVGPILAVTGLAIGLYTGAKGVYNAMTAKTDAEARNAWENIGTGTMTAVTCASGFLKLIPKDNTVTRTWLSEKLNLFCRIRPKKVTPSADGIVRKTFYGPTKLKRAFFNSAGNKEQILANANTFKSQGKWESLGLEIQKLKLLVKNAKGSEKQDLLDNIKSLTEAYKAGRAATYPTKSIVYAANGLFANAADDSATAIQTLYDATPAFAS